MEVVSPHVNEDRADVQRTLAGDVEAFEGIVRRWQGPLVNLAYRFCRDPGQAEEMAQEAFLRAYRFLDRWRGEAAFSTWLFAVATNVYRSELRRRRAVELPLENQPEPRDLADPEAEAAAHETAEAVRRAVGRLPGRYRDALILYYFLDLDVAVAARCLGVPAGTLKARLHRGRKRLERRLSSVLCPLQEKADEKRHHRPGAA